MKYSLFFLSLFLIPLSAYCQEIPNPPKICDYFQCHAPLKTMEENFLAAQAPITNDVPFVASGECYHMGGRLNQDTQHWGLFLLDKLNDNFYAGGSFGFFHPSNPYLDETVESARLKTPNLYQPNHLYYQTDTFAFANMNPGGSGSEKVLYWYKQANDKILLLSMWGNDHYFYCSLKKHNLPQ